MPENSMDLGWMIAALTFTIQMLQQILLFLVSKKKEMDTIPQPNNVTVSLGEVVATTNPAKIMSGFQDWNFGASPSNKG